MNGSLSSYTLFYIILEKKIDFTFTVHTDESVKKKEKSEIVIQISYLHLTVAATQINRSLLHT